MRANVQFVLLCMFSLFLASASSTLVPYDEYGVLTNISYPAATGRIGIRNYQVEGKLHFLRSDGCFPIVPEEREQIHSRMVVVNLGACSVEKKIQTVLRELDNNVIAILIVEQQPIPGFNTHTSDGSLYSPPLPIAYVSSFDMDVIKQQENFTEVVFVLTNEVGRWERLYLSDSVGAIYAILLCIKFGPVIFGAIVLRRSLQSNRNKDKRVPIIAISLIMVASVSYSFGVAFSLLINVRMPLQVNDYLHAPIWASVAQMSLFMSTVLIFFAWEAVLKNVKSTTTVQFIKVKALIIISSILGAVILAASVAIYVSYDILLGVLILQMVTGLTWLVLPILLIVMAVRWKKAIKGIQGQLPRMHAIEVFTKKVVVLIPFLIAQFIFVLMSIMLTSLPEVWIYFVIPMLGLVRAAVMYLEIYLFYYPAEANSATGTNSSGQPAGSSVSQYLSDDTNR